MAIVKDCVIDVSNVSKYYKLYSHPKDRLKEALHPFKREFHRKFYSLNNVDLCVKQGEILGIVGKNGSGKSTLLKLIAGVLKPSCGTIEVRGKVTALLELGGGLNPEFTGLENIHFYAQILGFGTKEIRSKIEEIIEFADIGEFIDQPLKTYSSGMKSRLNFAVAVHVDPEILILDEVLAVGDAVFKRKCYRKMDEFFNSGKTVLFVSHDENAVIQHCNRAILLDDHQIKMSGPPDEVISAYRQVSFSQFQQREIESSLSSKPNSSSIESFEESHLVSKDLRPTPTYINLHVAEFSEPKLLDQSQRNVNILTQGERYTLCFNCHFKKRLQDVSLGVQIRTLNGFLISGANLKDFEGDSIVVVEELKTVNMKWSFKCLLAPSIYTIYVYATSASTTDTVIVEDAMMFKVKPVTNLTGGVVNLEQSIEIDLQANDSK